MQIKRLAINTGSNVSVTFLRIIFAFIMTPILVENLLYHDYGIWEVCVSVIGYMGLLDLGLRPSITRHIAMYNSEKKRQEVLRVYSSSFFFMLLLGCISLIIFLIWAFFYPESLAEDNQNLERYKWLLIIIGCQLLVKFPGIAAESTLDGFHKYYLKNNITIINTIIGNIIIFFYITPENALLLVAGVSTVGITIKYFIFIGLLEKYYGLGERPNIRSFNLPTLKHLIRFGSKSFVQGVAWRIEHSITPILIATVTSPSYIVFYAIPANLTGYYRTLAMNLTQAMLPYFSETLNQGLDEKADIYQKSTKYLAAMLLPISVSMFLIGEDFIRLWIGADIAKNSSVILYILIFSTTLSSLDPLASKYVTAENKHLIYAKLAPIAVSINVIITFVSLSYIGINGAAFGAAIQVILFFPIYFLFRCKLQHVSGFSFIKHAYLPMLVPLTFLGGAYIFLKWLLAINSFGALIFVSISAMSVYLVSFYFISLNGAEKKFLRHKLRGKS